MPLFLNASGQVAYIACETAMPVAFAVRELYKMAEKLGFAKQKNLGILHEGPASHDTGKHVRVF